MSHRTRDLPSHTRRLFIKAANLQYNYTFYIGLPPLLSLGHSEFLLVVGGDRVRLAHAQLVGVPAVSLEILAELGVLLDNGVLSDVGEAEEGNGGRQQAQRRGDPEGVLRSLGGIVTTGLLNVGEDPGSNKGANFANGSGNAVVAATDTSGTGLGGQETNVVAGAKLTKTQEDAVNDGEGSDVSGDFGVDTSHDVADDGLQGNTDDEGVLGADDVAHKGTNHGAGDVEQVDDGVPAKDGGERGRVGVDAGQDGRRVDAEGIRGELRVH